MADQKQKAALSGRERRRQRRIRNQILAYTALALLLIGMVAGGVFGVRYAVGRIRDKRQEEALKKEMEALAQEQAQEQEEAQTEEEPEEEAEEYTEDDLLDEMVEASISGMPLEDRVAGLFLTTPEALTGTDNATIAGEGTEKALAQYPIGGLVYAASNIQSEDQFRKMLTDTLSKSKYQLFLILDDETDALTEDLSNYGINMEFSQKEGDGSDAPFYTVTLPSLLGGASEEGIVTVQVSGEGEELTDACMEAWENGADLLYVGEGITEAYKGMLERIQGDSALEDKLRESLETIYRTRCRNSLTE